MVVVRAFASVGNLSHSLDTAHSKRKLGSTVYANCDYAFAMVGIALFRHMRLDEWAAVAVNSRQKSANRP